MKKTKLCTFYSETEKEFIVSVVGNASTEKKWFALVNVLNSCGVNMHHMHAPNIILGIANSLDSDNSNYQVILNSKYYYYKYRYLGDKLRIHSGLIYLK